jgi:23S rRNA pseudouridine1911/1915/1917 synthase
VRLDAALVARGLARSRSEAQRMIGEGRVRVDGRSRPKSHEVSGAEKLVLLDPAQPGPAQAEPAPFRLVHEDEHLLVVDKPAGVVVHPGAGCRSGTLVQALAGRAGGGPDPERPGIVHRLDRDTSGLLVVARTDEAHARLVAMMKAREMERRYLALVDGRPDARSGTIDAPLGRDRARRIVQSTDTDSPRPAVTHFEVEEALPRTTLLDVRLETGRTHQIRAHLAAIGHPVCGDARYGGGPAGKRLGLTRQYLHARRLMFRHPITGERVLCESKPPADLCQAYDAAKREPVPGGPDGD